MGFTTSVHGNTRSAASFARNWLISKRREFGHVAMSQGSVAEDGRGRLAGHHGLAVSTDCNGSAAGAQRGNGGGRRSPGSTRRGGGRPDHARKRERCRASDDR